ncbi:uncharacterized protein F5147DRAFT_836967 [Suillus discolor]|uniref:Reverse transcriptase zinc-binding domain-containing protein n=1 Tax=Suillus discolor TaxID=1912936 RepID=A0A9P7JTZ9_9AGAM|nr:uncharacterized protein F5147DRAFT_836967 [Suillus discolor]KAG2108753.1 hypothetical protein F5147DRAFT_836967 [Suillus discolor]
MAAISLDRRIVKEGAFAHSLPHGTLRQDTASKSQFCVCPSCKGKMILPEDYSVFDILNVFRCCLFISQSDLVGHTVMATKSEMGQFTWLTLRPVYHSMVVKTALCTLFGDHYYPRLVNKIKSVLFVYLLEVANEEAPDAFFALEKGSTTHNRANREKKRLARKRSRAAKRERTRILEKGGHVAVALRRDPTLKKHTCKKSAEDPPSAANIDSTEGPAVTVPSQDVSVAVEAESSGSIPVLAIPQVPEGPVWQEALESHTAPHFAVWARENGVPRQHTVKRLMNTGEDWRKSPRFNCINCIDPKILHRSFIKLTAAFPKCLMGAYFALRSQHAPLNHHLHRIGKHPTPCCPHCPGTNETVAHYLLDCPHYRGERHILVSALGRKASSMSYLLTEAEAVPHLTRYLNTMGRLRKTFGDLPLPRKPPD